MYPDHDSSICVDIVLDTVGRHLFAGLTPDAYLARSNGDVIDSGPGPLDADTPFEPKAVEETPDGEKDMKTYLLPIFKRTFVVCLWLRPSGRRENEFRRIGLIKLNAYTSKYFNRPSQTVILV